MFQILALHALSTFSLTKMLLQYIQPLFLIGARMSIAGTILLTYHYFFTSHKPVMQKIHSLYIMQIVLFAIYIPYIFRYYGLLYCSEINAFLLYNSGHIITYLCILFFVVEKFNIHKMILLCVSYGALFLISPFILKHQSFELTNFGLPECALLCSVISFAYGWFLIRKLIIDFEYKPYMIHGISMICGGALALATSLCVEQAPFVTQAYPFIFPFIAIIFISNMVCHNWYGLLLKKYSQTFVALGSIFCPFFTAFYRMFFYNEGLSWHYYCGFALSLACFIAYYYLESELPVVERISAKKAETF